MGHWEVQAALDISNVGPLKVFTNSHFLTLASISSTDMVGKVCYFKGNIAARFRCTCHILSENDASKSTLVSDEIWKRLCMFYNSSHKTLLLAGEKANLKL